MAWLGILCVVKFIYSEKATKFCEISTLLLSTLHTDESKVEILQNFLAFCIKTCNFEPFCYLRKSVLLKREPNSKRT